VARHEHPSSVGRYNIIDTLSSSMASAFERIACVGTRRGGPIACSHKYRISIVAKVVSTCVVPLPRPLRVDSGWNRKSESIGWQGIWNRLKGKDGSAVGQTYHGRDRTTERVTSQPYLGIRIKFRDIAV
jgi:hypothetical protein